MITNEDMAAWAGADHVTRAAPEAVSGWRIPEADKMILETVGVPLVEQLIEAVDFQTGPDPTLATTAGTVLYRLTENRHGSIAPGLTWHFGAQPGTGKVFYVLPDGQAWFANSSISLWLATLHHYGRHVHHSPVLAEADEREDEALEELRQLARELRQIDPSAFNGYQGYIWAEFLDRWLW